MSAREAILSAADHVFGDVGFDAATTREIAALSGVNKALIHYHFKNKEALLASVLDRYYENLGGAIRESLSADAPLAERLKRLVHVYSEFLSANQRFCRIVQREAAGGPHAGRIRERMLPLFALGKELLVTTYPKTAGGDLAAEQLLVSLYGMIITYFTYSDVLEPLFSSDPLTPANLAARERHLQRIVDILLAAVEPRSPHA